MSELYIPNELVHLIYKQSIWLLIGDKKLRFKDVHHDVKKKRYVPNPKIKICFNHPLKELIVARDRAHFYKVRELAMSQVK